jgi:hypothetical protein
MGCNYGAGKKGNNGGRDNRKTLQFDVLYLLASNQYLGSAILSRLNVLAEVAMCPTSVTKIYYHRFSIEQISRIA